VADLSTLIATAAARHPDRTAWRFPEAEYTFADIDRLTAGYAQALRFTGVRPGDRVALMLRNQPEFPLLWLALARLGAAAVPVNVRYGPVDAGHVLRETRPVLVVAAPEFTDLLSGLTTVPVRPIDAIHPADGFIPAPVDPSTVVNVQYTSGTTGAPKGCLLSHRYWLTLAGSLVDEFPYLTADDVMLTAQPFHYIDPQWNVVAALASGAQLVVLDGFHPSTFWRDVRAHGATYVYCLGAMPTLLLAMPADPAERDHRVRVVQCSAIPPDRHRDLEARFGVPWFEAFGMTETGADIRVGADEHDELVGTGCIGRPARHRQAIVVDGHLRLRGPGMFDGYLGHPSPFLADGWFPTGDLARTDASGRIYLTGRAKDVIRRGGENISAHEVEQVLLSHPAVRLAAVVGVPDELRGEEIKAHVVASATAAELTGFCAARLARFKIPRYWQFHDDLPRTASERVAKHLLEGHTP
jgi:carnitine-CoA ligase